MSNKYRDYFSIDEHYFPSVNEDLLNKGLVDWTKFYPHETFVKLLKDTESVLSRNQKLSIWVEGAYGTGKSHAALTLKKLLDASKDDTKSYFEKYNLNKDLLTKIEGAKSQGTILTIHRYGSSDIHNDNDIIIAVQESVKKALVEKNVEFHCEETLKGAIVSWLSDEANRKYFNAKLEQNYSMLFGSDDADAILMKLQNLSDNNVVALIHKIFKVASEIGITAMKLDILGLKQWLVNVIKANNLKYIVFIWDEFTEYFVNNKNSLTGFQNLVELSASEPFCFIIVTHTSQGLFHDKDSDKKKILDRFIRPTSIITLPEHMAFRLMGAALEKVPDNQIKEAWNECADDLNERLKDSRNLIMNEAGISEDELKGILPIHPFTALMLKHLSSAFDSNQRSMFDFIKNNRGDDVKGFQWYIDNHGSFDDSEYLLTIDMLWDFFYENGKEHLDSRIRTILDSFNRKDTYELDNEQQRVFKTILLLQAISQKVGDTVELFIPNDKNIANAYDGTELESGRAISIAEKLVRDDVIYKKPTGLNKFQYSAMINTGNFNEIELNKKQLIDSKRTQDLVSEGNLIDVLNLSGALKLRYEVRTSTVDNLKQTVNTLRNLESKYENNILAIVTFAKDEGERSSLIKMIKDNITTQENDIVIIDTSLTPLGSDGYDQYIENLAYSKDYRGKDNGLANQYDNMAQDVLKKWKDRIANGEIIVFSKDNIDGIRFSDNASLQIRLKEIDYKRFSLGLEALSVTSTMYDANSLASGVQCGVTEVVSGAFRSSNDATKLENALNGAWMEKSYWTSNKGLLISKIKNNLDAEILKFFTQENRVSISQIYDMLKSEPYGFMPCNLTAFIIGFLLKEYAVDTYTWSDGTNSDQMSTDKLKEMISEIIKHQITPLPRYKDKYIVKLSDEVKSFRVATAKIFGISENQCTSIENTRDRLRSKMKELTFPIWSVKYIVAEDKLFTEQNIINSIIDDYCGVVNEANSSSSKTETQLSLEIGKLCVANPSVVDDLANLITKENCKKGMIIYLDKFQEGELKKIALEIGDNGEYIAALKAKFDADAAAWVWRHETVERKIQEIILEYNLIMASNKLIAKTTSFSDMVKGWCDKLNFYKLPFDTIKNEISDFRLLFECLLSIKQSGTVPDNIRETFLSQLKLKSDSFNTFWNTQFDLFKQIFDFELNDFSDDQINEVFKQISRVFAKGNSEYRQTVGELIGKYKLSMGRTKLRDLWYEKTGTDTPNAWSEKYKTPILCMVKPDSYYEKIKKAFDTVNRKNPDEDDINKALDVLQSTTLFEILLDSKMRDKCFVERIIRNYSVMLVDVEDVRKELSSRVASEVYDWFPNDAVSKLIEKYAVVKYNSGGCDEALQKIEKMEPEKLKSYLKDLIRDNITVGIEIINDK